MSCFRSYKAVSRPLGHYFIFLYPRAPLFLFYNHDSMGKTCVESRHRLHSTEIRILSSSSPCYPRAKTYHCFISTIPMFSKYCKSCENRRWVLLRPHDRPGKGTKLTRIKIIFKNSQKIPYKNIYFAKLSVSNILQFSLKRLVCHYAHIAYDAKICRVKIKTAFV